MIIIYETWCVYIYIYIYIHLCVDVYVYTQLCLFIAPGCPCQELLSKSEIHIVSNNNNIIINSCNK